MKWIKLETYRDMDTKITSASSGPRLLFMNGRYYFDSWRWPLPRPLNWLWQLLVGR